MHEPTPFRRINQYSSAHKANWATTLSFPLAGVWALVFAWFIPLLPEWLRVVLLVIGFTAIFLGFVALGVEIDAWRKRRG